MLSPAEVTVLFAASFTQTEMVDCEEPFAGIGFGEALATRCVAAPVPVKEIVVDAGVSPLDVAVAVQASATASAIVNFTVEPVAPRVVAVAGLPAPPAGEVLTTVAVQAVVVPVLYRFRVIGVATKTGLPEASWTWKVT